MAYAAELCGSKLKAKLGASLNESSAIPISKTSFAAKQMAKMGWTEGTGLGKNRDGIVSHIKVKQREESSGLGIEKEKTRQMGVEGMWWSTHVSDTLYKLQQKTMMNQKKNKKRKKSEGNDEEEDKEKNTTNDTEKRKKKKKKSSRSNLEEPKSQSQPHTSPKIYTDEELFQATGGARFGMRAQRRAEGKWARTESSHSLKEWEEQVKMKGVEWNGLGQAKVVFQSTTTTTTTSSSNNNNRSTSSIAVVSNSNSNSISSSQSSLNGTTSVIKQPSPKGPPTEDQDVSCDEITSNAKHKKKKMKKKYKSSSNSNVAIVIGEEDNVASFSKKRKKDEKKKK